MKVIVIENDKLKAKEIVNKISQSIINVRIFSIYYEVKEAIPVLIKNDIDIVIFDNCNQSLSNRELIKIMGQFKSKKIIIISNYKIPSIILRKNKYICLKYKNSQQLIDEVYEEIVKVNDELVIDRIRRELQELKFNFSHIGINYLIKTIYEVSKIKDKSNINLSKEIFPIVGKEFNKSANTIHSGIKRAVINMYYDCEETKINEYFKCFCFHERPRLKQMIFEILAKTEKKYDKQKYEI